MRTRFPGPILLAALLLPVLPAPSRARSEESALPVARGAAQLFVDDALISHHSGLRRTLHSPRKENGGSVPVLALDDEFGGVPATLEANGSIVYDPRLSRWVMFALAYSPGFPGPRADRVRLYRFTSPDGLAWTRGDSGRPERIAFDLLDRDTGQSATNIDLFSCWYDARNAQHPYQGWLYFANWGYGREGVYHVRSTDGHTWQRGVRVAYAGEHEVQQDGRELQGTGDVTIFAPDPEHGRFLGLFKYYSPTSVGPGNRLRSRAYAFVDRLDRPARLERISRVVLVPPAAEVGGDQPADEYYAATAWQAGSHWLGGLKIWHGEGDYPHSAAGCAFLKLAASRDGLSWNKLRYPNEAGQPEVFLANGREGGNEGRNDGGYVTEFSQGPLSLGQELVYYYGCSSYGKNAGGGRRVSGGGVFRARLRPDGYVSVDAGTLTTRPLRCEGESLTVNSSGPLRIELLDAAGRVAGSARLAGGGLRQPVSFGGRTLRAAAGSGDAQLRFSLGEGARLYAFRVD